ncbi:hypothetical protein TIFTF001_004402 [Ficus carica]|uniref:Uncharacterized protein n=1 Tax=Ficus carica TaxID=3494 RepID=A0AA88CX52_FICCA|nr:hypothetical protein TIFTF001_004402 [Ficus carica]
MYRHGPNWFNPQAKQTFNLMKGDRVTQMTQLASGSSSSSVQEDAILQQVLGMRRGHMMGVGTTLPRRTIPGVSSSSGSQLECSSSSQLPSEYLSWINHLEVINRLRVNHKNMYANKMMMQ